MLLVLGAVIIVSKTRTSQFAHGAHPWEFVDVPYHPWQETVRGRRMHTKKRTCEHNLSIT